MRNERIGNEDTGACSAEDERALQGRRPAPARRRQAGALTAWGFRFAAAAALVLGSRADAAYLADVPQRLVQPDDSVVEALATGDEFRHRLHDAAGFTIVQDPRSGWFVYAEKVDGLLRPTLLRPGLDDPEAAGLERDLVESRDVCRPVDGSRLERERASRALARGAEAAPAVTGTWGNIVVFVRFADQPESGADVEPWETVFNGAAPASSVRAYFEEASYGQMSFRTTFLPSPSGGKVVSYQDSHPRSYFSPYNEVTNPGGYRDGADPSTSGEERMVALMRDALRAVEPLLPPGTVLDANGDGTLDAVILKIQGATDTWGDMLWPAAWSFGPADLPSFGGKRVRKVVVVPGQYAQTYTVYCHELSHVVGFPDLYHYERDGLAPVGIWDMMAGNRAHPGAHMKWRYPRWIDSIPEISTSGAYTLAPLTSPAGNAWRIASPITAGEYFVLEYRRKEGSFESALPASGLLVYRIDPSKRGNADGPPDEVYLYRPGGTPATNGTVDKAAYSAESGQTAIDRTTDPAPFLASGSLGGLRVYDVGPAGETIGFKVEILPPCYSIARAATPADGGAVVVTGAESCPGGYAGGTTVSVGATPAAGSSFLGWTASGGKIADASSTSTTFTVSTGPQADPTVSASFSKDGDPEKRLLLDVPYQGVTETTGAMKYYYVSVPPEVDVFSVTLEGRGYLFLSPGRRPTTSNYGCGRGSSSGKPVTCSFPRPATGIWWVGVWELQPGIAFTLTATAGSSCGAPVLTPPTPEGFAAAGGRGSVAVSAGCPWAAVAKAPWLSVTSGWSGSGPGVVTYSVAPNLGSAPRTGALEIGGTAFTVSQAGGTAATEGILFVPIVLDVRGIGTSHYTSELTLTNRGDRDATLRLSYAGAATLGGGTATKEVTLPARSQRVEPDAIGFLSGAGTVPAAGNRGGTLSIRVSGVSSLSDVGATVRTTTAVPNGQAGLAYGATPAWKALAGPSYVCGLREDPSDRSNVALQNAGGPGDGDVTLRMTVVSGDGARRAVLPDVTLPPGGFTQVGGVLGANGMANGYVKVERVGGTAPYFAYGVVNDQVNSDGSFVPPQPATTAPVTGLTVPVVLEAGVYTSELVVTNWADRRRELTLSFVSDQVDRPDRTASVALPLEAGAQVILPNVFQYFRDRSAAGIGPASNGYVGALFLTSGDGDLSGVVAGARTSAPGGGGKYGLFYPATPFGGASSGESWIYGLRQDASNRTNLAIVNTGEAGGDEDGFEVDVWDGASGRLVRTVTGLAVRAKRWTQVNNALATWAPGVANGFLRVRRVSGTNPFVAYGVVNDGGVPQQRSDDGAFLAAAE